MIKFIAFLLSFLLLILPLTVQAQDFQLSSPLLQGTPAPFSGLLITEEHAAQCIEDAAAVQRLTLELSVRNQELEISSRLRDQFIAEQNSRIEALSQKSWWDDNGNIFMLGVGLILGIAASALVVGLSN